MPYIFCIEVVQHLQSLAQVLDSRRLPVLQEVAQPKGSQVVVSCSGEWLYGHVYQWLGGFMGVS
jgi:hypothetical protein